MIKNIIFDFGDVFINLDKPATLQCLSDLGVSEISDEMMDIYESYEIGEITTQEFLRSFTSLYPQIKSEDFVDAWNAILKDFPKHRFEFLKDLKKSKQYRLFLLSNTNELHISWIQKDWGMKLYDEFKSQFERFYLSHEIHMRKPNKEIYEFVIQSNSLIPDETIFIDDTKANTETAKNLGIRVWNIDPESEDVVDLLSRKEFRS